MLPLIGRRKELSEDGDRHHSDILLTSVTVGAYRTTAVAYPPREDVTVTVAGFGYGRTLS